MTRFVTAALLLGLASWAQAQDRNRTPPRCKDVCRWVNVTYCNPQGVNCWTVREWRCPNWCRE